jgi:4-amino-4-deoxy-L-arabinose transferase-like glycosyltransferase
MARRHPDFLQFYFVHEHFDRFAKDEHKRTGPLVYFVPVVLAGFLPWTAFLGRLRETWPGLARAAWKARATEGFLWMFSGLVFLFFSVSRSKLIPYVLPIWPALAVLLALGIERARGGGASFRGERAATGILFGALLVAGAAYGFGAGYLARFDAAVAGACALLALFGGFLLNVSPRLTGRADAASLVAAPWLAFTAFLLAVLPGAARWVTPWPVVAPALAALDGDALLVQRGHYLEVLPFYAARTTPVAALGWSELDFGRSHPGTDALFPADEAFADLWNGPRKVVAMVHRDHVAAFAKPPLSETPAWVLGRENNAKHVALTNRITESQSK